MSEVQAISGAFQFTPLHERQHMRPRFSTANSLFQFTPLHERQHMRPRFSTANSLFQFTPLHERQLMCGLTPLERYSFQFTPLHERQLELITYLSFLLLFQFTPLHERQRTLPESIFKRLAISIHASTWEATTSGLLSVCGNIFQFTPLHERQRDPKDKGSKNKYFNSRLYMRGNLVAAMTYSPAYNFNSRLYMRGNGLTDEVTLPDFISIHASTWEATAARESGATTTIHFNSRLYMRGNGTIARGRATSNYFNSRLYMRGNFKRWWWFSLSHISIHASTWEATRISNKSDICDKFQFTPLHERQHSPENNL